MIRHVKKTLSSLTWEMLAWENIKKHKRLVLRLEALYLVKNIFCLYFSPIPKLWTRKKVIFKVFAFWRYFKTLSFSTFHAYFCFFCCFWTGKWLLDRFLFLCFFVCYLIFPFNTAIEQLYFFTTFQKHSSTGVSPKCDFNKVAIENRIESEYKV